MALNNFITSKGLFGPQAVVTMVPWLKPISNMIQVMSSAPFIFLPILVGFSAAKRFGANRFLGGMIGMMMDVPEFDCGPLMGAIWDARFPDTVHVPGLSRYWRPYGSCPFWRSSSTSTYQKPWTLRLPTLDRVLLPAS